ncbi:MAG: DNA-binding response regulator, partial [Candidatus Hydrogenedentota bacterium]
FLTAKDDAQSRIEGQKCGGDDYLTKPFDLDALEVRIRAQLKKLSKDELVERIGEILDLPEPRGFLAKLDPEELTILLKQVEKKLKAK